MVVTLSMQGYELMPPITDEEYADAAFADHVSELPANLYYVSATPYEVRIALGISKQNAKGDITIGNYHTAVHLDYKIAKALASTLQVYVAGYERTYGRADILPWK